MGEEEFLGKDREGREIYWEPDKFCETGLCNHCRYEKGKCPNEYIDEDTGDAYYCIWYKPNSN